MITTAYPIWAILGKQQKKFVIIFCQTQAQAKQHMMNLRSELEDNDLLKKTLVPFVKIAMSGALILWCFQIPMLA